MASRAGIDFRWSDPLWAPRRGSSRARTPGGMASRVSFDVHDVPPDVRNVNTSLTESLGTRPARRYIAAILAGEGARACIAPTGPLPYRGKSLRKLQSEQRALLAARQQENYEKLRRPGRTKLDPTRLESTCPAGAHLPVAARPPLPRLLADSTPAGQNAPATQAHGAILRPSLHKVHNVYTMRSDFIPNLTAAHARVGKLGRRCISGQC